DAAFGDPGSGERPAALERGGQRGRGRRELGAKRASAIDRSQHLAVRVEEGPETDRLPVLEGPSLLAHPGVSERTGEPRRQPAAERPRPLSVRAEVVLLAEPSLAVEHPHHLL